MKLYFKNSKGKETLIGEPASYKEAVQKINDFLKDHNYTSYYMRLSMNREEHFIWFDVGSHSEFFYLRNVEDSVMDGVLNGA